MTEAEKPYEALTPIQVEQQLRNLHNQSRAAEKDIRACRSIVARMRGEQTSAKAVLDFAISDATLSPDCPVMGRGPGEVAKAVQAAWIVAQTRAERMKLVEAQAAVQRAAATLESARDFSKSVSEQLMAVQSINKSVIEAYRTGGGQR